MKSPQTVKALNALIQTNFTVLEFSRAYLEFPFTVTLMGESITRVYRVIAKTVALKGEESLCCAQIWGALYDSVNSFDVVQDHAAMLLVRKWFELERSLEGEVCVNGWLAFYEPAYQERLLKHRVIKPEGSVTLDAIRE